MIETSINKSRAQSVYYCFLLFVHRHKELDWWLITIWTRVFKDVGMQRDSVCVLLGNIVSEDALAWDQQCRLGITTPQF